VCLLHTGRRVAEIGCAANHILFADRVREAPLSAARKRGPGIFPRSR
jgi:hypothetical protein